MPSEPDSSSEAFRGKFIRVEVKEAVAAVEDGRISDAKSAVALLLAAGR